MDLFLNINILCSKGFEENILFNHYILNWIKNQDIQRIWVISNEEKIGNELNEKIFDAKLEYIRKILEIKTKKEVFWRYCPYKQKDIILIDSIIKDFHIRRELCVFLGNSQEQENDANGYKIEYINESSI